MKTLKKKNYVVPSAETWRFASAELIMASFDVRDMENDNDDSEGMYDII